MVTLQFVENILVFYFFGLKSSFLCLLIWTRQQVFLETSYLMLVCRTSSKFIGTSSDDGGTHSLDLLLCQDFNIIYSQLIPRWDVTPSYFQILLDGPTLRQVCKNFRFRWWRTRLLCYIRSLSDYPHHNFTQGRF